MSPRHLIPKPEPIPSFWSASIKLGKTTELEYYKHIYPRILFKRIVKGLESSLGFWNGKEHARTIVIKSLIKKWEAMLK